MEYCTSVIMIILLALALEQEGGSIEELVKEADKEMYEKKKQYYQEIGRDRRGNTANRKQG